MTICLFILCILFDPIFVQHTYGQNSAKIQTPLQTRFGILHQESKTELKGDFMALVVGAPILALSFIPLAVNVRSLGGRTTREEQFTWGIGGVITGSVGILFSSITLAVMFQEQRLATDRFLHIPFIQMIPQILYYTSLVVISGVNVSRAINPQHDNNQTASLNMAIAPYFIPGKAGSIGFHVHLQR